MRKESERPEKIVFMLALWGEAYISKFFAYSLRSLLACGNIPSMSEAFDCTFLFLTKASDVPFFQAQTGYQQLARHCRVEFIEIADLIFDGSYSATLTLGFERGMRSRKEQMCSTYFIFLVSDYILADGSLHNLKHYIYKGYSGITSGNFLVVEEYVAPLLQNLMHKHPDGLISLKSREMISMALPYLHPVSTAHIVNQPYTHAAHANRLFWKMNDHVLVGRFYLRHMLCIKPEIPDFKIGSSCDYSFIPEMCPSGNVAHIQDSDEYCLIEMAPFNYELQFIEQGTYSKEKLAAHLCGWTTEVHRKNAHIPTIFHTQDLNEEHLSLVQESGEYVNDVEAMLKPEPQPIRGHYYWRSCVDSFLHGAFSSQDREKYYKAGVFAGIIGSPTFFPCWSSATDDRTFLQIDSPSAIASNFTNKRQFKARLKKWLVGTLPLATPFQLHWSDDVKLRDTLHKMLDKSDCVLIAMEPIRELITWLERSYPGKCSYFFHQFLIRGLHNEASASFADKDILVWATEEAFFDLGATLRQCTPYLSADKKLVISLRHKKPVLQKKFQRILSIFLADLQHIGWRCETREMLCSLPYLYFANWAEKYQKRAFAPRKKIWHRLSGFLGLGFVALGSFCLNRLSNSQRKRKRATSSLLIFRKF